MRKLDPPREVRWVADRLEAAGFETWCVGGAVRDALLGVEHLDWDLATSATPREVQQLFRKTKPIGIDFGTVGVIDREGRMHEVTTFRHDVRTDGRHAEVEFGASLDEDLARRDFTINAIAFSPSRDIVHDPFGGRQDLERRLVRAVGDPHARMREDRLRALRAIRFAARFEFELEAETWRAVVESAPHLGRLSAERVQQELEKTMEQVRCPSRALARWQESGALATLAPGLDLSPIALDTLDRLPPPGPRMRPHRIVARLAALFLDLDGGRATTLLRDLRFPKDTIKWAGAMGDLWRGLGREMGETMAHGIPDDRTLRRWVAWIQRTRVPGFMRLANARWSAVRDGGPIAERSGREPSPASAAPSASASRSAYRRMIRIAHRDPVELADLAIDGDDLRRAGIPPGKIMGDILQALLDAVLEDPALNTPERLLAMAKALFERGPH